MTSPPPWAAIDFGSSHLTACVQGDPAVHHLGPGAPTLPVRPPPHVAPRVWRHDEMLSEPRVRSAVREVTALVDAPARVVLMLPVRVSGTTHRAAQDAAKAAGAQGVALGAEQAVATAIGAGVDVAGRRPVAIVDVGGGVTQAAVLRSGKVVHSGVASVGSVDIDLAIQRWLHRSHDLAVAWSTAERIKREALSVARGSADRWSDLRIEIAARHTKTALPSTESMVVGEIREAVEPVMAAIIDLVASTLTEGPIASRDLRRHGIVLAGGGALLDGLATRMSEALAMPVRVPDDASTLILTGMRHLLNDLASDAA